MLFKLIAVFLFFLLTCIITGYGESYRIMDVQRYSKLWHNLQWLERVGLFLSGIFIALIIGFNWLLVGISLCMGIMFFILYDGIINITVYARNFFYVSETTTAWTEKYAHWWVKIPLMMIISVINILLFRVYTEKTHSDDIL